MGIVRIDGPPVGVIPAEQFMFGVGYDPLTGDDHLIVRIVAKGVEYVFSLGCAPPDDIRASLDASEKSMGNAKDRVPQNQSMN